MDFKLKVHLVFPGNCEDAFNTYKEVLNGEIVFIFRKGDNKTATVSDAEKNKIAHIVLRTEHFNLQAEDADAGALVTTGSTKLVLEFRDLGEVRHVFGVLSQGGTIVAPLEKTFHCEATGEVIDKFGTRWELYKE
ncbi:MAG: VOC family protein [Tannerella sp.]|nr:VOC family protein [Tannerella sp.]